MNGRTNPLLVRRALVSLGPVLCALAFSVPVARAGGASPGAVPAGPAFVADVQIDDRVDGRVTLLDTRVADPVITQQAAPQTAPPKRTRAIPYRVEPAEADDASIGNGWDLPPEVPDGRDFERVDTYDELSNPHYEIREEIWKTPEDFIDPRGVIGNPDGLAYVPFWARNAIRWGRLQIFPFVSEQLVFTSESVGDAPAAEEWHASSTAGVLAEYMFEGGRTKLKVGVRGTYDWVIDGNDADAWTYAGGVSLESRLGCSLTLHGGIEFEKTLCSPLQHPTPDDEAHDISYWSAFFDVLWDRFPSCDGRVEFGARYSATDLVDHDIGDHEDLSFYARISWAIMRHESFAYAQYKYEERDAHGGAADLKYAHEVDLGINNILPHGRTRRLDGNVWVGYRWEKYSDDGFFPPDLPLPGDRTPDAFVAGAELTYRPSPYTSGHLTYERTMEFSTYSTFSWTNRVLLGVTQNLSHRIVGRIVAEWSRVEPDGYTDVDRVGLGAGVRWMLSDSIDLTADYEYRHRWAGGTLLEGDSHRVSVGVTLQVR